VEECKPVVYRSGALVGWSPTSLVRMGSTSSLGLAGVGAASTLEVEAGAATAATGAGLTEATSGAAPRKFPPSPAGVSSRREGAQLAESSS